VTDRLIRSAQQDDLEAIVAIYNDVMQTSFTIWREEPTSLAERQEWLAGSSAMGYPVLVATDVSGVLGFIAAEPFRPWPGYAQRGSTPSTSVVMRAVAVSGVACLTRWK
jgi:L-amino acid N-acyltransferase